MLQRLGLVIFVGWIVAFLLRAVMKAAQRARTGTYTGSPGPWGQDQRNQEQGPRDNPSQRHRSPHEVLGVHPGASQEEISAAYRRLVQQYHPDKVADLGPEFRELAEQRMKEINAAYQSLKRHASS
ncbi:MAG: J domain-containing protein [Dehalococcoidia bacterium]|nr:J domain-containing protein [Dehalococcoidia bacterium]